ncbi:lipopolysaccharide assembly LapA domain-containing protein [Aerococcaceae bacterium WGS1372]
MKEQWKVILIIILLILVVIFALQNTNVVTIDLFFSQFNVSLVLVVLFSILVGVIIGMVTSMGAIQSNRRKNKQLEKQLGKERSENASSILKKDSTIAQLRKDLEENELKNKHTTMYVQEDTHDVNNNLVDESVDNNVDDIKGV